MKRKDWTMALLSGLLVYSDMILTPDELTRLCIPSAPGQAMMFALQPEQTKRTRSIVCTQPFTRWDTHFTRKARRIRSCPPPNIVRWAYMKVSHVSGKTRLPVPVIFQDGFTRRWWKPSEP